MAREDYQSCVEGMTEVTPHVRSSGCFKMGFRREARGENAIVRQALRRGFSKDCYSVTNYKSVANGGLAARGSSSKSGCDREAGHGAWPDEENSAGRLRPGSE